MAILMIKTGRHAKATAHSVATAQHVVSAASVPSAQKATSARMTAQKQVQMLVRKAVPRIAAKAAIHATSAGVIVAHVVTKQAKLR